MTLISACLTVVGYLPLAKPTRQHMHVCMLGSGWAPEGFSAQTARPPGFNNTCSAPGWHPSHHPGVGPSLSGAASTC